MELDLIVRQELEAYPRAWLKREFYRINKYTQEFWDGTSSPSVSNPSAIVENVTDVYDRKVAIYRLGYMVFIEQGINSMAGPHRAMLVLQRRGMPEPAWLGTAQFEGNFYNDNALRKQLRYAIRKREYFCSMVSAEEDITLSPEGEETLSHSVFEEPIKWHGQGWRVIPSTRHTCPKCKKTKKSSRALIKHAWVKHRLRLMIRHPAVEFNGWDRGQRYKGLTKPR